MRGICGRWARDRAVHPSSLATRRPHDNSAQWFVEAGARCVVRHLVRRRSHLDSVVGQLDDPAAVLAARPELHEPSSRLTVAQLTRLRDLEPDLQLIDVRDQRETDLGTLPGALHIPLAVLTESLDALDRDAVVVAYCASGYRSQVSASVLRAAGFAHVSDLLGGYAAWEGAGLPIQLDVGEVETNDAAGHL